MFGAFIKIIRLEKNLSLREFSRMIKEDPSNWSKIERGILKPPRSDNKLSIIAKILKITKGSEDWEKLVDYSNIDSGNIPEYIMNNKEVINFLPAFFRTIDNIKPNDKEIKKLIKKIKKINFE